MPSPDFKSALTNRRHFLQVVGGAAAVGALPSFVGQSGLYAAPSAKSSAATVVGEFYRTLSDKQRETICFPFDHELRKRINANWHITKPTVGDDFYTKEQQALVNQIVKHVSSEDGYERLLKQMEDDDGGLNFYSVAVFGEPGTSDFEWELTGRHLTLRADGNSVPGAAFGGPIVYGHGESDPNENLYHYQTKQTNEVFKALDANQAKQALLTKAPGEAQVGLKGANAKFPGIAVGSLADDQKALVKETLGVLFGPYRQEDIDEAMQVLDANGGVDSLHMAFYEQGDLNEDRVWDIWRVEGPGFVWHFRGAPHVHAYINIGAVKKA
ncbi:MAG: DUF3500 domain-containing protein [Planctomycetaceae bacterium]|nr:DUF3500 domain-containing protein [Planctomycetaceae bacterium]MCB9949526.1 DUF3500 domain-containing protein [Planctomycetaceae bacterium]